MTCLILGSSRGTIPERENSDPSCSLRFQRSCRAQEARPCLLRVLYKGGVRGETDALRGGVRVAGRDTVPDPGLKPHVAKCPSRTLGVPRTVARRRPRAGRRRQGRVSPCLARSIISGSMFRPPISTHTVYPAAASAVDCPTPLKAMPNWPPC